MEAKVGEVQQSQRKATNSQKSKTLLEHKIDIIREHKRSKSSKFSTTVLELISKHFRIKALFAWVGCTYLYINPDNEEIR